MNSMLIDFENLDLDSLHKEYKEDSYFSSVLDFLNDYFLQGLFHSYSSGSTGSPKEIIIERKRADESAQISNRYFGINETSHIVACLDIKFIGSKLLLIRANLTKAKVIVLKPSLDFYNYLTKDRYDFISLTTIHVAHILDTNPSILNKFKKCLIGASSVSHSLEKRINVANLSTIFYESFGMTETLSHIAIRNISSGERSFHVLEGYRITLTKDFCLCVEHPIVLPEKIITNDIVEILNSKEFLWKGRKDNVINSSGIKINPEYLENLFSQYLPFKFILAGTPEESLGQQLILVREIDDKPLSAEEIKTLIKKSGVKSYYIPKDYYYSEHWTETPSYKPVREKILDKIRLI